MIESVRNNDTVRLVEKFGYDMVAKEMGMPVKAIQDYVINLYGQHDFSYFSLVNLKIRDKQGKLVPLQLNRGQKKILTAIERQRALGRPVRIKLAKARQYGGSTFIQAHGFRDAVMEKHLQFLTVCHDMDSAKNMRAMFERYYDNYPRSKEKVFKGQSDKWWKFKKSDVDYIIDTADELDTGRSFTIHRLHGSEVAFYRNPEVLMTALLQSVPDSANSSVFLESTANGLGGWWYEFVKADNDYELVFVAWWEIEEYTKPFENDTEKARFRLDAYEQSLIDNFGITLEQLNWRRYTVENKLNGDEDKFRQEYPATLDESFLTSGRPYFPVTIVRDNLLRTEKLPARRGFLEWEKGKVQFVEDRNGFWTVLKEPEGGYNYRYVTGSDSAEGKIVNETKRDPDNSVCTVLDRVTNQEVAQFCGKVDTDVFGNEIYKASRWYGSACDCVERNSAGIAVIDSLKHKNDIYLYRRELLGKSEEKETVEYGFQTNTASRDSLLSELRTRVREKSFLSDNPETWREFSTFVYDEKGKPQGQRGCHDDRVFSSALAVEAVVQANEVQPVERPKEKQRFAPDVYFSFTREEEHSIDAEF